MLQAIYNETKDLMQKSIQALNRDFSTLRSAKVSVNILDH
ncbi:ribosome-recycling factor, partial [Helicobacter pylori]